MDVDFKYLGFESSVIVGNNRNHLTLLRNWLAPVAKSVNSLWKRCWRASVDGWAGSTFHSRCDSKGPTVTIIRVGRYIFGGYTSISWGKWAFIISYGGDIYTFGVIGIHMFSKKCSLVLSNMESCDSTFHTWLSSGGQRFQVNSSRCGPISPQGARTAPPTLTWCEWTLHPFSRILVLRMVSDAFLACQNVPKFQANTIEL